MGAMAGAIDEQAEGGERAGAPVSPADVTADLSPPPEGEAGTGSGTVTGAGAKAAFVDPELGFGAPFGPYRIIDEIGRGGMGVVYRAEHTGLGREVALKTLRADLAGTAAAERFVREARSAARFGKHPHLVQVFDAGEVKGIPFIAMEYVKGRSLDEAVEKGGPLSEEELLPLGRKLAIALDHAHARGIVHRDIKPANVILDGSGEPQIVDFGLARDMSRQSRISLTGAIIGTPAYMPPEQADPSRGQVDRRADVYALGATLYHAATGEEPFRARSIARTLMMVLTSDPVPLHKVAPVSRALSAVIDKAMAKAPAQRYETALALADDLSRVMAAVRPRAPALGPTRRLWRRAMRHRGVAVMSLVLAAFLAVTAVGFWLRKLEVDALWERAAGQAARATAVELRGLLSQAMPIIEEARVLATEGDLPVDDQEALAQ
jgi:serine/threonine protein kinase